MATLPRPNSQLPKNFAQFRPQIIYPRPSNSGFLNSNESNFNTFSASSSSLSNRIDNTNNDPDNYIEDQLKITRKGAQQCFDSYMSKIRQVERNITLVKRRMEQKARATTSKTSESISSLYSEILQLNNMHNILKRKIDTVNKTTLKGTQKGLKKATKILDKDFHEFDSDFNESLSNIETLVKNLETKVQSIKKCLSSFNTFPSSVSANEAKIKEINADHNFNVEKLKAIEIELSEDSMNDQNIKLEQFDQRLKSLKLRIEELQNKTTFAFNQSQTAFVTAQTGTFELRSKFDKKMNKTMENFNTSIDDIKKQIKKLTKNKSKYIDETKDRIKKSKEMISKIQKKKLKKAADLDRNNDFSIKNQIKLMKQKVENMEQILNDRKMNKISSESKNGLKKDNLAEIYYNVREDGSVKIMIVVGDFVLL